MCIYQNTSEMHKTMERELFNQMLHVQTQKSTLSLANQLRAVTGVFRPLKTSFFACMGTQTRPSEHFRAGTVKQKC